MPAKRTSKAKGQTKPASKAVQKATRAVPLNDTQERIIDAVSDMLAHGGHEDDITLLITGAMTHMEYRRIGAPPRDDVDGREKLIWRRIRDGVAGWRADLATVWRSNKRKGRPNFDAKTISERIRARRRDILSERFEDFLRDATPEETVLLDAIFAIREGGVQDSLDGVDEIPLGEAFASQLDRNETYIRLPKDFRGKVQKYIDKLQAIEDKTV